MRRVVRSMLRIAPLILVFGCAAAPVSVEKAEFAERRLLMPYLQNRTVACNQLLVEITPNFHLHVSNPGTDPQRHRFERVMKTAQVDKVWTNVAGGQAGWFTVTIGAPADPAEVGANPGPRTTFKVMNQFTLRVRERGQMRLDCVADGPILMVRGAAGEFRDAQSFAITDGVERSI